MSALRAAVLGLAGRAEALVQAIANSADFALVSASDADRSRLERRFSQYRAATYDDHRSAISSASADGVEAFFVVLPPKQASRYLPLIAATNLPAFAFPPIAIDLETCLRTATAFRDAGRWLCLAPDWTATDSSPDVPGLMDETGDVHLAVVEAAWCHNEPTGWRADSKEAGGGVLLHGGFEAIGIVVQLFGLPEEVYADMRLKPAGEHGRLHDTEDTAVVHLRYATGPAAAVVCRRAELPGGLRASLYGARGKMDWTTGVFRAAAGRTIDTDVEATRRTVLAQSLDAFARAVRQPPPRNAGLDLHVQTMAVISAAYLSARTGEPESLARIQDRLLASDYLIST